MIMLLITLVVNWFVIFATANIFVEVIPALIVSIVIVAALVALSASPVADYLVRMQFGCREATGVEAETFRPALQRVWNRVMEARPVGNSLLAIERAPVVYVCNNKHPNAYAIGTRSVVVTTGLLGVVSDEELEGLLAHEVGHIMNRDSVKRMAAQVLNSAGNIASWVMVGVLAFFAFLGDLAGGRGLVALVVGVIALILKMALRVVQYLLDLGMLAVGRLEEYRADAYAKSLGFGPGLVSFLDRMQYIEQLPQGLWAAISRTHPPTAERIRRLEMS